MPGAWRWVPRFFTRPDRALRLAGKTFKNNRLSSAAGVRPEKSPGERADGLVRSVQDTDSVVNSACCAMLNISRRGVVGAVTNRL